MFLSSDSLNPLKRVNSILTGYFVEVKIENMPICLNPLKRVNSILTEFVGDLIEEGLQCLNPLKRVNSILTATGTIYVLDAWLESLNPLKRVNSILTEDNWIEFVDGEESQSPQTGQFNSYNLLFFQMEQK